MRLGRAADIPLTILLLRQLRYGGMIVGDRLVFGLAGFDQVQTDTLQSAMAELQGLSRAIRQVNDPAWYDRSAVVDPDHDGLAIPKVCDLHEASDGKCQVRRGHIVHFVRFAACRRFSLKPLSVPGSSSDLERL